jgi:ABC-type transporter Mla subunit MlaD
MMADPDILARLDDLQTSVDAIVRGLSLMNDTLATHSDMLAEILQAAAAEPDQESGLADTLERLFSTLNTQTDTLVAIGGMLGQMGSTIEGAVIRGVHRAVGSVDEDGVIIE